ncbi:MAG TPA: hypothetical protein VFT21_07665 [Gemmatimonadaceae bacterium]|nr:hypothetical protein [Gemmatimonadaceae bacterium]
MTTKILRRKFIDIAITSIGLVGTCVTVFKASRSLRFSKRSAKSGHFPALRPTILQQTTED